jgi:8-oxo-dGTP pyrophosphatase MutT (NUDIX family)
VGLSPPDPPWLALDDADRRFTVADVRTLCTRLRRPRTNPIHEVAEPRPAATLVPVVDERGEAAVLLTQRPSTMRYHRGDWVFPGGRVDVDGHEAAADAARREAEEELGIAGARFELVGTLDTHGPIVTGFVIEVFVGVIEGPLELAPDPREVAAVRALTLSSCMRGDTYSRVRAAPEHEPGPSASGAPPARAGDVGRGLSSFALPNGDLVWGTQGEILYNLLEQLARLRLADLAR